MLQGPLELCATLFALVVLAASAASAADLSVICPGGGPGAYSSINAALNTLDPVGPHSITVSGTCHENVALTERDRLTIHAVAGQFATIENAAAPAVTTLYIAGSHNIFLDHLIIQGGAPAMYVSVSSGDVHMQNCIVQNSLSDGLDIDGASFLFVNNSTIKNNSGAGVFISNLSTLGLGVSPTESIRITGNGFGGGGNGSDGLNIDGSNVQVNFGVLTVDGNQGAGINMEGGRLQLYGGEADSPGVIENNHTGLRMNDAASATLWSAVRIHNNGSTGISVSGTSSITFYSTVDSKGQNAVTTIDGHSNVGLALNQSSSQIYGAHIIRNNGSANAGSGGGVSLERASLTIGGGTSVSSNVGTGILGDAHSGIVLGPNASVTNNSSSGIRLKHLSLVGLTAPVTIQSNGGGNIACDSTSLAYGQLAGITGVQCGDE
jgi:hypothetical protein